MVIDETQLGLTGVRRLKKLGAAEQGKSQEGGQIAITGKRVCKLVMMRNF